MLLVAHMKILVYTIFLCAISLNFTLILFYCKYFSLYHHPFTAHLKEQLETYMAQYSVVKIVRENARVGLIRARLSGARHATADVLTYLDSHCECTTGKKFNGGRELG